MDILYLFLKKVQGIIASPFGPLHWILENPYLLPFPIPNIFWILPFYYVKVRFRSLLGNQYLVPAPLVQIPFNFPPPPFQLCGRHMTSHLFPSNTVMSRVTMEAALHPGGGSVCKWQLSKVMQKCKYSD